MRRTRKKTGRQVLKALFVLGGFALATASVAFPLWLSAPKRTNVFDPKAPTATPTATVNTPNATQTYEAQQTQTAVAALSTSTYTPTHTLTPTPCATQNQVGLISDFEAGLLSDTAQTTSWYGYYDGAQGALTIQVVQPGMGCSNYAMGVSIPATTSWLGFGINVGSVDASAYTGLQFYAKADQDINGIPLEVDDTTGGYAQTNANVGTSWTKVEVPFYSAYGNVPSLNLAAIKQFQANLWSPSSWTPPAPVGLIIDNVRFANVGCFIDPGHGVAQQVPWYDETTTACVAGFGSCIGGCKDDTTMSNGSSSPHSGTRYLKIDMNSSNWGWDTVNFFDFDGSGVGGSGTDASKQINITNMDTIEFWIRASGPDAITCFGIWLGDASAANTGQDLGATQPGCTARYIISGTVPTSWTKVVLPLCGFDFTTGSVDKTHIAQVGFFAGCLSSYSAEIDIDDAYFVRYNP